MRRSDEQVSIFLEVQKFRQVWVLLVVFVVAALIWYGAAKQLLFHIPFGNKPAPDFMLAILWFVFGICLPAAFLFGRLVIEVRNDGIYIRFFPFHSSFRRIAIEELTRYEARTYHPIRDYGGWGIKTGVRGRAYTVSGNRGVELEYSNGKRLLIGSQRPEELLLAIQTIHSGQVGKSSLA